APPEAAGQALPLARTVQPAPAESGSGAAGDVRRQVAAGETVMASPAFPAVSPPPATGASVPAAAGGSATMAAGLSVDDVVEQVMRRLSRSLTVENERLGGRRWP
ncbi:MAG TPA: hypothetical protein DD490_26205, partial [Acidobacteria bacterium]|nr:hypothetical protein [Acidobacteriota bacterium]